MIYLNEVESFKFSGGEIQVKLTKTQRQNLLIHPIAEIIISAKVQSPDDIMKLLLTTDAIRRTIADPNKNIQLVLPYLPYARQDRVMTEGESLSLKVFCDVINTQNYSRVTVQDPHSDVGPALLKNCHIVNNHNFISRTISKLGLPKLTVVSPDAGSNKKIKDLMQDLKKHDQNDALEMIKCDKTRDVATGKITGFEVYSNDLKGSPCIIVDDICDGGGTFIGLAKELKAKGAGDLYLAVTHGIFSKGVEVLTDDFKTIFTTDSFETKINDKNLIKL